MTAPGAQGGRSTSRFVYGLMIAALVVVVVAVAVSAVLVVGDDGSEPASPDDNVVADQDPAGTGPPAKVELRRVLELLPRSANCSKAGTWCDAGKTGAYRLGPVELQTSDIVVAEARLSAYGEYVVGIQLSERGSAKFEAVTRDLAEKPGAVDPQLAIVVDSVVISAPVVQGVVTGGAIDISADFTQAEAERLAESIDP